MKKFKAGIFAIIAVLTMSFTVAEHKGLFKKNADPEICRQGIDATQITVAGTPYGSGISVCNKTLEGLCATVVTSAPTNIPCEGEEIFCCAVLSTTCGTNQRIVSEILCME